MSTMFDQDTIAAISSGLTESGIGIVRISGPESYRIAGDIFRNGKSEPVDLSEPNRVRHGYIRSADGRGASLDEVLLLNMKAPHSYTGEDTIEIDCHGGVLMMKRVLETVLNAGARLADPGEFTKRAFLNGRIDLAQAEAVIDVINAKNDNAIRASVEQLKGNMSEAVRKLREEILEKTAYIEAALDDPEHYSLEREWREELEAQLGRLQKELERLIASYQSGKLIREGIRTVIIGKPNAGKSSLLNAMLGEERAIVTQIPGTTRDTISESISLGNLTLHLMDTAGIRKTDDLVEQIGVERALQSAEKADLVLCVIDASAPLDQSDREILSYIQHQPVRTLFLLNKSDLDTVVQAEEILGSMPEDKRDFLVISALQGSGIRELTEYIENMFSLGEISYNDEVIVSSLRHVELLKQAHASLAAVTESIRMEMPEDFYTVDLMDAYRALGQIIGASVEDDLVNEIFGKFCMGK